MHWGPRCGLTIFSWLNTEWVQRTSYRCEYIHWTTIHHNFITCMLWHLKSLANWLFVQELMHAENNEIINIPFYCPFVSKIQLQQRPVESPHKEPIIQKGFAYHDNIMYCNLRINLKMHAYVDMINWEQCKVVATLSVLHIHMSHSLIQQWYTQQRSSNNPSTGTLSLGNIYFHITYLQQEKYKLNFG